MPTSNFKYAPILERPLFNGIQKIYSFPNKYGASVIRHMGSYGREDNLWELAVIKFNKKGEWQLNYKTDITDDVLGHLTDDNVEELLARIEKLSPRGKERKEKNNG